MPTTTINTAQSFSGWHLYASGNGLDISAQPRIESLPATAADGLVDGFEEGRRARLISTNLSGKNIKKQARQIDKIAARRPSVKKPFLTVTINLKPGEKLRSHESVEMINNFRRAMGLMNCPFAAFEHREKPHQHFHAGFSLLDFDGQVVRCSYDRLQARTWAREMEIKYNLTPTPQRSPRRLMTSEESEKFKRDGTLPLFVRIQNQIDENLNNSAGRFVELMEAKNIGVIVRFEKGQPVGISFAAPEKKYAGGKLGTEFTWGGLLARGMDYNPSRDDEKLISASERSVAKFSAQTVVPKKPKPGKKSSALPENSKQNSVHKNEQKTGEVSQPIESESLKKTGEPAVDNSSRRQEFPLEKTVADSVSEKSSDEIQNLGKIVAEPLPIKAVKHSEKPSELFTSPSIKMQNRAKADGEITLLGNESKLPASNKVFGAPDEEQKATKPETITASELSVIDAVESAERAEKTNVKTADENASISTEKTVAETEIKDESENVNTKPKIRDFSIANREHLFDQLVAEANEELSRLTGITLSYPQEKGLKVFYRIQSENQPTITQVMELNVLQKNFEEPLPQPKSFFEANVIKIDNGSEAHKSEILGRQIERVNKNIELKANQKRESENYTLSADKTNASARTALVNPLARLPERVEAAGIVPPSNALSHSDQPVSKKDAADWLYGQIKQSLDEQAIKLKSPAQKFLNDTINSWANQPPTGEESRKVEKILENNGDNLNPANKLEAVSLIFADADERECDKISFELASDAETNIRGAAGKEINRREINSDLSLIYGKSAMSDELSAPPQNTNFAGDTDNDQTESGRRQYLINEIVRISRDSAGGQQIEVSPQAWQALTTEFTSESVSQSASQSQKQRLASLQAAIPKEEAVDAEHLSKLDAVYLTLKFSSADYRDELVRDTLEHFEKVCEIADRRAFVAPPCEQAPVIKTVEISNSGKNSSDGAEIIERDIKHPAYANNNEIPERAKPIMAENISAFSNSSALHQSEERETAKNSNQPSAQPRQSGGDEISEAERILRAELAFHQREVAESRQKDFSSVHENAERFASSATREQQQRNNALSSNAVSEIWRRKYKEAYQIQWENNRDLRINRRENEVREAVAISAKTLSINKSEKGETTLAAKTNTEIVEKTPVDEKVAYLIQNVRQSNQEWNQAKDFQATAELPRQQARVMQFFIERDSTVAPNRETVETAIFIARMNHFKTPEFTNELDAKVWVVTQLPDTGKQLFIENYIEQVQANTDQMLAEMRNIQLNESMQIIRLRAEQSNRELNQAESDKIWQSLQLARANPVNSQTAAIINQFQSDNKNTEPVLPVSQLDAVHTILTKGSDAERKEISDTKIETANNEIRQKQAEAESEYRLADEQKIRVLIQKPILLIGDD